ncbi:MAG: xylulokinase [Planctomycetota bacterium]
MSTFLGFDVGTQSVKALLLDDARGVLGTAADPLTTIAGLPPGHSEQDPATWIAAMVGAARRLAEADPVAFAAVAAIGVSGQQHGLVPLDADRRVIRPAKLWNDVSSAAQCAAIEREVGGAGALMALTGNRLPPGFTAGKIRWLREMEPANFARLRHVLLPHDYANLWLTGELRGEAGDASGTGLFDVRRRRFVAAVLDATAPGLADMLPPLVEAGQPVGTLRAAVAAELGLGPGILVAHGGGDNMMAAIGAGAVEPGIAVVSLGTSGTVFACAEQPVCDPAGEIAAFCDSTGRWLPLGCTMNATVSTELTRSLLGQSLTAMETEAAAAPPGAGGVLCLPFFTGERTPNLPQATGGLLGLTPGNMTRGHVARAAMEGATFALTGLLRRLGELGLPLRELRLTGGGSNSDLWCRIVAAAGGHEVRTGVHPDAAALGAAVQACWTWRRQERPSTTVADVLREVPVLAEGSRIAPDREWQAVYAERQAAYAVAVSALGPHFAALRGGEP